jgi:hypothetical protein
MGVPHIDRAASQTIAVSMFLATGPVKTSTVNDAISR